MNTASPVSDAIAGVEFAFLLSDEIKALSVKRLTNPTTFDTLLHPTPGGLYDPTLGAFLDNRCATCQLGEFGGCPGHCGHIELPTRVYHPSFMDQALRLLRGKCVFCHRFKMSRTDVHLYACKLRLVHHGLLEEASAVEDIVAKDPKKGTELGEDEQEGEWLSADEGDEVNSTIQQQKQFTENAIRRAPKRSPENNEALLEARREIIKEFLANLTKGQTCRNCQGISPSYRKDRYVKIFRRTVSAKQDSHNYQRDLVMKNPLVILSERRKAQQKEKPPRNSGVVDEAVADLDISSAEEMEIDEPTRDVEMSGTRDVIEIEGAVAQKSTEYKQEYVSANEVHAALVLLFEHEPEILPLVYSPRSKPNKGSSMADMFFIDALLVPPSKYRPEAKTGNAQIAESPQNNLYRQILTICETIGLINQEMRGVAGTEERRRLRGWDDLQLSFIQLQDAVNSLIDRDRNPIQGAAGKRNEDGIKQILEKKEGLFRKNMMGKRVNFAARSVISPDPNIETNEIGVPPVFAKKLTYPEPVTSHNFYELKEAVINGPDVWPGAVAIENENGQIVALGRKTLEERASLANQLLAVSSTKMNGSKNKKVHRHLNNGDIVIMNRQPTLHKPSMMAHRARVLPGEKTIRMHYANCNTYNADFDGDEMNMHFPQNEIARAEAMTIADTDNQYLSGTAGKPLRGLIQDHISVCVQLTNKDIFFTRAEYQQIVYSAMRPESNHTTSGTLLTVPPAIIKPQPLWTGKQLITTVMKNITPRTHVGLTLKGKSQTPAQLWGDKSEEGQVIFQDGELLCGIIDKSQIGPAGGGFVNAVYEAYGHTIAGKLLSIMGRLLTKMLHIRAFSCGVEDLILTEESEKARLERLLQAETVGFEVAASYVSLDSEKIRSDDPELRRRLEEVMRDDDKQKGLDELSKKRGSALSSDVTKVCLPVGLVKPFPKNQMQTMTCSGAKGSQVNANLISCNLGQQVLEGRRVPTMVSGKTLPSFRPFDPSLRAGGYVRDRFLTGVRPQEYFFHAMGGREGLIDTAVKTSRSGYLQRCLIKGMEGLKVEYDSSVRDSDGTVVQFLYGEDGLEIPKAKYLTDFTFLAENFGSFHQSLKVQDQYPRIQCPEAVEHNKKAIKAYRKTGDLGVMDPVQAQYTPNRYAGSISEKFYAKMKKYLDTNPDKTIADKKKGIKGVTKKKNFEALLEVKYLKSIVESGEAVGVVAGQSVGEPSTQMTLNTFHLAGHSAKNVTLGIPRLREITMTASANISTPMMTIYPHSHNSIEQAEQFAKAISRLSLAEVVDRVTVNETLCRGKLYNQAKVYDVRLEFFPAKEYCEEYAISPNDVLEAVGRKMLPKLQAMIRAELKKKGDTKLLKKTDAMPEVGESSGRIEEAAAESLPAGGDSDDEGGDGDATSAKQRANRSEGAGYEAPDEEDERIIAQGRREASPDVEMDDDGPMGNTDPDNEQTDEEGNKARAQHIAKQTLREIESRIMSLKGNSELASFSFDSKGGWCNFTLEYSASSAKLLMLNMVVKACHDAVIQAVENIKSCFLDKDNTYTDPEGNGRTEPAIITEGVNMVAIREFQDMIDPNRVFTNDIVAMLRLYGVEACRATIVREVDAVFKGHSISVDNRHLNLIADVMTRGGGFKAFNRMGMKSSVSPFMKMSFETTVGFLRDAVLEDEQESLKNPSARIVVGKLGGMGTGAFDVLMPVDPVHGGEFFED
ncbi:DNA-directed RNA polymerase I subunit RPA1 [Trichodelitschia bisporula]|uniref:DNA-directed RNA polymerase subunit n=1 Tax=Trichodelitschia bisporula TaxID=703511 RepID=A0A6G1I2H9_9PEZI|nr:DNA-directed RNA polymerase I subunit RPA1 [Trichodelitschia bisporula]